MGSQHSRIISLASISISKWTHVITHNKLYLAFYTVVVGALIACKYLRIKYLKISLVSRYKYKLKGKKRKETGRLRNYRVHNERIRMITRADECEAELSEVEWDEMKILGLDCEWSRKPVALLQLALPDGTCYLIHLCRMGSMPPTLGSVLANKRCV